jgi:hypothetical protein
VIQRRRKLKYFSGHVEGYAILAWSLFLAGKWHSPNRRVCSTSSRGIGSNYFRYVIASVFEIINIFDRTHLQVQVRGS